MTLIPLLSSFNIKLLYFLLNLLGIVIMLIKSFELKLSTSPINHKLFQVNK